jgi:transposase
MNTPDRIDISPKELDALLERVKAGNLDENDYEIIKAMADTVSYLSHLSDEKASTIKRLLKMLFGDQSEKAEKVLDKPKRERGKKDKANKKPKGHGRKPASAYTGAKKLKIPHESLKHGRRCPECQRGRVYRDLTPAKAVRITGSAPLKATVYEMERLRCNLCGQIFTAKAPESIGDEKYDAASGAMIALLKYGSGLPFNRLEQLQGALGVPLAASTQWEIVDDSADKILPAWQQLVRQAAQGAVLYNDDTTVRILSLIKENAAADPKRKGMFTSGILSEVEGRKVALFFTGRNHAGENLAQVLEKRQAKDPPIQMCDALSRNLPQKFVTLLANCLVHARRNFVDVHASFPTPCQFVIETLAEVYKNDHKTKKRNMSAQERLAYHQSHSAPLMQKIETRLDEQLSEKKVEPNSGLGKAMTYMQNHWQALTLFLRVAGAPLDNNLCEQVLKRAILHRKNSLFYKTEKGAFVGDLYMSLIHTCSLNDTNPFDYLTALIKHHDLVREIPQDWMPWNFTDALPESN